MFKGKPQNFIYSAFCAENVTGNVFPSEHVYSFHRFTQNLSAFRREVNDSMKNSTYGVNSNDMMS